MPDGIVPSIACVKQSADEDTYHYVLVRTDCSFPNEDEASDIAQRDLDTAASHDRADAPHAFAASLREAGYVCLSDF
jgi:hypothetical protein